MLPPSSRNWQLITPIFHINVEQYASKQGSLTEGEGLVQLTSLD
jgi:hypothetical protein